MAEIKNYTMNFSYGRPAGLTCVRKLACTEIHGGHFSSLVLG
jgi:hypothetical protein